jgi:hypothetical protein
MGNRSSLPKQSDITKLFKAAFDAGSDKARLEVLGLVFEASKQAFESSDISPLDTWRKQHGQG